MAVITRYQATLVLIDGVKRESVVQYYVSETDALAWLNAADPTARLATAVGTLLNRANIMSLMDLVSMSVSLADLQDTVTIPAVTVLRGNKLQFSSRGSGRGFTHTLPGRDPATFTQGANSLNVSLTTPTAMSNYVTSFNATALTIDGAAQEIETGKVVD